MTGDEHLLHALQALNEHDLLHTVLIPLFSSIGYTRIDVHHGPDELGKDLICWRKDEILDLELAVVQVKRYRPTRRASSSRSFSEIVTQLSQAAEEYLPHIDGGTYRPSLIYFVSPFPLNTRTLLSRLHGFQALRNRGLKLIDGYKLCDLIRHRLPTLATSLSGAPASLGLSTHDILDNRILLNALEFTSTRHVSQYFVNIDLVVGRRDMRALLLSPLAPQSITHTVNSQEWRELKDVSLLLKHQAGVTVLGERLEAIERRFARSLTRHVATEKAEAERRTDLSSRLREDIKGIATSISALTVAYCSPTSGGTRTSINEHRALALTATSLRSPSELANDRLGHELFCQQLRNAMDSIVSEADTHQTAQAMESIAHLRSTQGEMRHIDKAYNIAQPSLWQMVRLLCNVVDLFCLLHRPASTHSIDTSRHTVAVNIVGRDLASAIRTARSTIKQTVKTLNSDERTQTRIQEGLRTIRGIFEWAGAALANRQIRDSVGIDVRKSGEHKTDEYRLVVPILEILRSGENLAIIGDAGAGKTTSLQMYAHELLTAERRDAPAVFIPLSRLVDEPQGDRNRPTHLRTRIASYLCRRAGYAHQIPEVEELLTKRGAVILLDGLDEALYREPRLIDDITDLAQKSSSVQIVASSRPSAGVLRLPFTALTLLPFTAKQRSSFIERWFAADGEPGRVKAAKVREHLRTHRHFANAVSLPLLATVLCTLESHGVALPDQESRLYEARMRLLLGHLDLAKSVARLKSQSPVLNEMARIIAFHLHYNRRRDMPRQQMYRIVSERKRMALSDHDCRQGVDELIDPCNVLVPMTDDGGFGFGHLRFQEYLCAEEVATNRGIDLLEIARDGWWGGVLELFAMICRDVWPIINEFIKSPDRRRYVAAIERIVASKPAKERESLRSRAREAFRAVEDFDNLMEKYRREDITEDTRELFMPRDPTDADNDNDNDNDETR